MKAVLTLAGRLSSAVRLGNWWTHKMPPLLLVVYVEMLRRHASLGAAVAATGVLLVCIACVAAYGHVVNDWCDIADDERAGKPNAMRGVGVGRRAAACVSFVSVAFLILALLPNAWPARIALAANFLWPTLYSIPRVRLKERGIAGILSDAAGSHITPTAFALAESAIFAPGRASGLLVAALLLWATTLGLKGILHHQIADEANDRIAGVATFAVAHDSQRLSSVLTIYNLAIELPVSVFLLVTITSVLPLALVAIVAYLAVETTKYALGFEFAVSGDARLRRPSIPFANELFYTLWLPFAGALQLALHGGGFLLFPVVHGMLFRERFVAQIADARSILANLTMRTRRPRPKAVADRTTRRPGVVRAAERAVVHIGDSDGGGGAANAMVRLHVSLQHLGVTSRLLVRTRREPDGDAATIVTRGDLDPAFPIVRDAIVRRSVDDNRTGISNTHFSLHIDGADLSKHPLVAACDVVHLHWTAPFQTPADVRALAAIKPLVWTLHDLEPLSGGCHFPSACDGYVRDCAACPQLARDPFGIPAATLIDKITLWSRIRPTFVAPSRYIADCARRGAVSRSAEAAIVHLPHGIDIETFRPRSRAGARQILDLPSDAYVVLCGSNSNAERRKGLRLLDTIAGIAKARAGDAAQVLVLTVGEPNVTFDGTESVRIVQLGRVPLERMPIVYAAADVFMHLALEDNFPGMVLEALSCGTPVLAFDVGGVGEIVDDGSCGLLVAAGDEAAMAVTLSTLLLDDARRRQMGIRARAHVEEHFTAALAARRHRDLYDDLIARGTASFPADTASRPRALDTIYAPWSHACLAGEIEAGRARIAELAGDNADLARALARERSHVLQKDAEVNAIHAVAYERERAIESLHAAAAEGMASLQAEVDDRDAALRRIEARTTELYDEIALVHFAAAERGRLIEELHEAAERNRRLAMPAEAEVAGADFGAAEISPLSP